jgi:hypothetical protein
LGKARYKRGDKNYDLIVPQGGNVRRDHDFASLGKVLESLSHCALEDLTLVVRLNRIYITSNQNGGAEDRDIGSEDENEDEDEDDHYYSGSDSDSDTGSYWNQYVANLTTPRWINGNLVNFEFLKNLGTQWKRIHIMYTPLFQPEKDDKKSIAADTVVLPII